MKHTIDITEPKGNKIEHCELEITLLSEVDQCRNKNLIIYNTFDENKELVSNIEVSTEYDYGDTINYIGKSLQEAIEIYNNL
ncbi:MAG: hypothetical protein JST04_00975 [Bdellovibrionales bacterium]|nr:hypothetical protein [Bdellovibrionales bacterium]